MLYRNVCKCSWVATHRLLRSCYNFFLKIIADGIDVDAGINIKHQCLHETRLTNNICVKVYDIIMILDKILKKKLKDLKCKCVFLPFCSN